MRQLRLIAAFSALGAIVAVADAQSPVPTLNPSAPVTAPVPPPPSPLGIASYPAPPGGPTLWSYLGLSSSQREYRQRAQERIPFGKVRSKVQTPLSKATGGLIKPFPSPVPSAAEFLDPGPIGRAAKVKADRAAAAERVKAVEYLATVDCHYWPEAEDALVGGLRADRNETVRYAAAVTLGKGCCCTKKTVMALSNAASCSNADGNPTEKSARVVAAARAALARCFSKLNCTPSLAPVEAVPSTPGVPVVPEDERPKGAEAAGYTEVAWAKPGPGQERPAPAAAKAATPAGPSPKDYYDRTARAPWPHVLRNASLALLQGPRIPTEVMVTGPDMDAELSGVDFPDPSLTARAQDPDRPTNLLDILLGTQTVDPAPASATSVPPMAVTPVVPAPTPVQPVGPTSFFQSPVSR
jgi:hypothetical protein